MVILGGVNDALDLHAICVRMIENQMLFEMPDSPHSNGGEFRGLAGGAHARCLRKFKKSGAGFGEKAARCGETGVFPEIGEVPDEITPRSRPYGDSGHGRLRFLPGPQQCQPRPFNFGPVAIGHFPGFSAGLRLVEECVHALLPMLIHGNRPALALREAQKEFGRLFEELFVAGKFSALHSFVDAFFKFGWQGEIHRPFLPSPILRQEDAAFKGKRSAISGQRSAKDLAPDRPPGQWLIADRSPPDSSRMETL